MCMVYFEMELRRHTHCVWWRGKLRRIYLRDANLQEQFGTKILTYYIGVSMALPETFSSFFSVATCFLEIRQGNQGDDIDMIDNFVVYMDSSKIYSLFLI
jgi:hypothetical protein